MADEEKNEQTEGERAARRPGDRAGDSGRGAAQAEEQPQAEEAPAEEPKAEEAPAEEPAGRGGARRGGRR